MIRNDDGTFTMSRIELIQFLRTCSYDVAHSHNGAGLKECFDATTAYIENPEKSRLLAKVKLRERILKGEKTI